MALQVVEPGLVCSIVAFVPDKVSMVSVRVAMNVQASSHNILDVSVVSTHPSHLLQVATLEGSGNSVVAEVGIVSSAMDN